MKYKNQLKKYILSDYLTALLAWFLFYIFRRIEIDLIAIRDIQMFVPMYNARLTMLVVPVFWLGVYWLSGYYNTSFLKSRLSELFTTFASVFFGTLVIFFAVLVDDPVSSYTFYYVSFLVLFSIHFVLTYFCRLVITTISAKLIHNRQKGFRTLILGVGDKAFKLSSELNQMKQSLGYMIEGFVVAQKKEQQKVASNDILGTILDINSLLKKYNVDVVIIAVDNISEDEIYQLMYDLCSKNVKIKIVPGLFEILTGTVKMKSIYAVPLIDLVEVRMSDFQKNVKRVIDVVTSLFVLLLLMPLFFFLAIKIKSDSEGSMIYKQERIGLHGVPFIIYKFRTMYQDSEREGIPKLSCENDERVTRFGKFMRKYRLDELPQFYNVLKGEMSLVGPRPERRYFIDQIIQQAPYYQRLTNVRPGITSWGMVKFGYANTVEKMIERSRFDISYMENMSLIIDIKILIYTIKTIFTGKGL